MADEEQTNSDDEQNSSNPLAEPSNSENTNTENHHQRPYNTERNRRRNVSRFARIWKAIWYNGNQARVQNVIGLFMFLVTVWLAIVTYQVFLVAAGQANSVIQAGNAAEQSTKIAQSTLTETKRFNNTTLANQKASDRKTDSLDSIKSKHDDSVFYYQKKSLQAQITSIQETQKEFEIENKPFLQIADFAFDTLVAGKPVSLSFNFKNSGKQPVKMLTNETQIYYWEVMKKLHMVDTGFSKQVVNSNLGGGVVYFVNETLHTAIKKIDSIAIKRGIMAYYINGILTFRNSVTNKTSQYIYTYKIYYIAGKLVNDGIKDTTIEIPNKKRLGQKK